MNSVHHLERWNTKRGSREKTETGTYYKGKKTEMVQTRLWMVNTKQSEGREDRERTELTS